MRPTYIRLEDLYSAIENHALFTEEERKAFIKLAKHVSEVQKIKTSQPQLEISGLIFKHGDNDYELYTEIPFTKEEHSIITNLCSIYETEGNSVRGTKEEIIEEYSQSFNKALQK